MSLLDFLFPPVCCGCKAAGAYLCASCKKKLTPHPAMCPACHKAAPNSTTCLACKTTKPDWKVDGCVIGFTYNDLIKTLIRKLKYGHRKHIASFLGQQLSFFCWSNPELMAKITASSGPVYLTSVPSHRRRRYVVKGYNQATVLAKSLSEHMQLPFRQICYKQKRTASQVKLGRQQRQKNVAKAFHLFRPLQGNETIIIVDDIVTTGATLNEMAKTIKSVYPNVTIRGCAVARHG